MTQQSPQEVARRILDGLTLHADKEPCRVDAGDIRTLCSAVLAGQWISVDAQKPPTDGCSVYVGINSNGYAACFNLFSNGTCYMNTAEEHECVMSGLSLWRELDSPPPPTQGAHAADEPRED